jgi:transposase-like protein
MDNTALQPVLDALMEELAARVAGKIAPQRKELYTVQDLCERYGVSDDTITRWMRAGEFGETVNPTPRIHLAEKIATLPMQTKLVFAAAAEMAAIIHDAKGA